MQEPDPDDERVTLVVRDEGLLVLGKRDDVDRYVATLRSSDAAKLDDLGLTTQSMADTAAAVSALGAMHAASGEFVRLSPKSLELLRQRQSIPASPGFYLGAVRGEGGKIAGLLEFQEVTLAAEKALSLELALATVALRAAINEVQVAVARVEDKVSDLLALAKAQTIGEIVAYHQLLVDLVDRMERNDTLPTVDWETVAGLGPDLAKGVETLRKFVRLRVDNLDDSLPAQERSRRLRQAANESRIGEVLQLLIVAEDSVYLWQRLRIERVRETDGEHLINVIDSAKDQLRAHLQADGELVHDLRDALRVYATLRPLEVHRFRSRDKLEADVSGLRSDLDDFASSRRMQVVSWPDIERPSLRDARQDLGQKSLDAGPAVRGAGAQVIDFSARQTRRAAESAKHLRDRHG